MFNVGNKDFMNLMIIELSGISVAYNCIFDISTTRAYFLKTELRGERDEVN